MSKVYFLFFQMNEFLVILEFKKRQNIGQSIFVFLKCLKERKNADFDYIFNSIKACFIANGANKK